MKDNVGFNRTLSYLDFFDKIFQTNRLLPGTTLMMTLFMLWETTRGFPVYTNWQKLNRIFEIERNKPIMFKINL